MSRVSFYTRPYDRLEPYDGKLSRTVLRGGSGSNVTLLPDIHEEKDILKLVTTLMANTKGEGTGGAPFWEKSEKLLYTALIAYLHYEAPAEEQNFATLLEMLNTILQLRGVRPFLSDKYDLTQHPNYKLTSDYDPKNTFDIEKYLNRKEKIHPGDEFIVVDADSFPSA